MKNARFASIRSELKVRTSLQDSWFLLKNVFNDIANRNNLTLSEIDQLAQVSYLLKAADTELCRIKSSLASKNENDKTVNQKLVKNGEQLNITELDTDKSYAHKDTYESIKTDNNAQEHLSQSKQSDQHNNIETDEADLSIFISEIESYILNDSLVRELDRDISDHFDTSLTYDQSFAESLASIFRNMRMDKIDTIKTRLNENKKVISTLMKHIFGDMTGTQPTNVHRGSSLLILFYILIAQTCNIEIIKRHIRDYTNLEGLTVDEFANDLLFYYKKSV